MLVVGCNVVDVLFKNQGKGKEYNELGRTIMYMSKKAYWVDQKKKIDATNLTILMSHWPNISCSYIANILLLAILYYLLFDPRRC